MSQKINLVKIISIILVVFLHRKNIIIIQIKKNGYNNNN
jgi:hypothetical protein